MPNEQPEILSKQDKKAIPSSVILSVTIPLDKLQGAGAILRILQVQIVVASKNRSYPVDKAIMWSHHHLSFNGQHPCARLHQVA